MIRGRVRRTTFPGDRRDYYQIADDMHLRLLERQIKGVEVLLERLSAGRDRVPLGVEQIGDRFTAIIGFYGEFRTKLLEMRPKAEGITLD